MVTNSDAYIVRAALGAVILVRITKANTKAVAGELNPGLGQGRHSTPWDGRVLVGRRSIVSCYCWAVAGRHTGGEGTHYLPVKGSIAGEANIALRPIRIHLLAITAGGILQRLSRCQEVPLPRSSHQIYDIWSSALRLGAREGTWLSYFMLKWQVEFCNK